MSLLWDLIVEFLWENKVSRFIAGIIFLILAVVCYYVASYIAHEGIRYAILAVILFPVAILLGYFRELIGTIIFVIMINYLDKEIYGLIEIWGSYPKMNNTIGYLMNQGFLKAFLIVFFVTFTISFLTGSINIFRVSSISNSESKTRKKEKKVPANKVPSKPIEDDN